MRNKHVKPEMLYLAIAVGSMLLIFGKMDNIFSTIELHPDNLAIDIFIFTILIAIIIFCLVKIDPTLFVKLSDECKKVIINYENKLNFKMKDRGAPNCAIAYFELGDIQKKYAACSRTNLEKNFEEYILCYDTNIVDTYFPVKQRLTPDLKWKDYDKLGYAATRKSCCERRICAQIIKEFGEDKLEGGNLIIYTDLEPCIYCYKALQYMKDELKVNVTVFFRDMVSELDLRDEEIEPDVIETAKKLYEEFIEKYKKQESRRTK